MATQHAAYTAIFQYIRDDGGPFSNWYVGVTSDPVRRLFTDHSVRQDSRSWIYQQVPTSHDARAVERALLRLGCQGGTGGGSEASNYVYAFKLVV